MKTVMSSKLSKGVNKIITAALGKATGYTLITQINHWLSCSGKEWTCNRLKALRTGLYQLRAGHPEIAQAIWQSNSIAYHKSDMLPKGIYRQIGKMYLKAKRPVVIRKYDLVLRIYTSFKLPGLTNSQLKKCQKAINSPYGGDDAFLFEMCDRIARETDKLGFKRVKPPKPDLSKMKRTKKTHKSCRVSHEVLKMPWGNHIASLWTSVYLPDQLTSINPAERLRCELVKSGADNETCGHIAFIQENGCKARVVAVPNVWIQLMLKPLEDVLSELIKSLPESCRNDQVNGAYFIQNSFENGKTLYCYDLSSATDRFPLPLQETVLNHLCYKEYSRAIRHIANGPWRVSVKTSRKVSIEETWHYKTGQPMGMYCSFALFHLTHILLLRSIESDVGAKGTFTVLGDDVIINHPEVAKHYSDVMQRLNVDVSESKTIVSDKLAEYAGFVGYNLNGKCTIHRPFKFTGSNNMGNSIHLLNALGKTSKKLGTWYSNSYELFKFTISDRFPDLSPIAASNDDAFTGQRLNSHLLGSISNRLSYELPFEVTDELLSIYELQQIVLLGEKEKVVDGFASRENNLRMFTPRVLEDMIPEKEESLIHSYRVQFSKDPLIRVQRSLHEGSNS